jgi:hypothetical protein
MPDRLTPGMPFDQWGSGLGDFPGAERLWTRVQHGEQLVAQELVLQVHGVHRPAQREHTRTVDASGTHQQAGQHA